MKNLVVATLATCAIVTAQAEVPEEIASTTLDNGLRVIVWPDHDIPNVVMYNYVRAGGRNEYPGITGLSHFFEHMMFNGTAERGPGSFDREMEAAGGSNNAYTSNDVTVYQDWFPTSALETIFDLEADRFQFLSIDPEVVESERGVVYSERRLRVDNNNLLRLYEQMRATAYLAHPYQFPVIGWPSDIENWTIEDLQNYYRTYYAPNNCTVIFAGDVTADEIFSLAKEYFGPIPSQDPPPPVRTVEPEQRGERRITVINDAQTPMMHFAYHGGSATDPDTVALQLLVRILATGESSRLHRLLVEEKQAAISVGSFFDAGFDPGLIYFYMTLPSGGDLAATETMFKQVLQGVTEDGVSEDELEKARNIVLADYWRQLATIDGKAAQLGQFEVFNGSYEQLFDVPDILAGITVADLTMAAQKVFRPDNATVGWLHAAEAEE